MKIQRLQIDGFGHFQDFSLELGTGLNLVHGDNEAGKSTLLGFIRCVLFGFEKRNDPLRYEPPSGPFGGELLLETSRGPLLVRRMGGKRVEGDLSVKGPHGAPESPSRLTDALHGVSRELFCQVFAFGLTELSSFEELAAQSSVTEALFAAGMQGARRLPEVTAELRKASEELYKPAGRKQVLNAVLSRLEEVRAELAVLGDRPARYFELLARRDRLEAEVAEVQAALVRARTERDRLLMLEKIAPQLIALARVREELAALPSDLDGFPSDGVSRLEAALERRRRALAALREDSAELERLGAERLRIEAELVPQDVADRLRAAREAFFARLELHRALPARRAELLARRAQAEEAVRALGLGIDAEVLLAVDVGAAAKTALTSLQARIGDGARTVRDRQAEVRECRQRLEDVRADLGRRQQEHDELCSTSAEELRRRQGALGRLPTLDIEARRLEEQRTDLARELDEVKAPAEAPPRAAIPGWWIAVAALMAAGIGAAAWILSGQATGIVASALGILLVAAITAFQRRSAAQHRDALAAHASRMKKREAQAARLGEALTRVEERLSQVARDRDLAAQEANLPSGRPRAASDPELRAAQEKVAEELRQADRRAQLAVELAGLADREARLLGELELAEERLRKAEAAGAAERAHLSEFLAERRMPQTLEPDAALSLFAAVADAQRTVREVSAQQTALAADEAACREAAERLRAAAAEAKLDGDEAEALCSLAAGLLERRAAAQERSQELSLRMEELSARISRTEAERDEADGAAAALLARGGASDEESFRARAEQAARRGALVQEVRTLEAAISAGARTTPDDAAKALAELGGEASAAERRETLSREVEALEARQKSVDEERGAVRTELATLESDGRVAELRAEEERLVQRAQLLARRYAKERLGLALLSRARRRYEEEQQPQVIKLASRHFAQLTAFRYPRVFVPAGEATELRVVDGRGQEKSAEVLSRGAREQLYLAFRMAVVEHFGDTRGPLPVVLDDILVNFDPHRARNAVKALARLSEKHQVIAFTCHPWLRELFVQQEAKVVELSTAASPVAVVTG